MLNTSIPSLIGSALLTMNVATVELSQPSLQILSEHEIRLDQRVEGGGTMSDIMADNILLNLAFLNRDQIDPKNIEWDKIRANRTISFKLEPDKVFAFHEDVLSEYEGRVTQTTNAHFNYAQGFKYDGYLVGDGVCHLASLMYWVAKDAGLNTKAPTSHDFMSIPGISREFGVSIFYMPGSKEANARQNLYISNTRSKDLIFRFIVEDKNLKFQIAEN